MSERGAERPASREVVANGVSETSAPRAVTGGSREPRRAFGDHASGERRTNAVSPEAFAHTSASGRATEVVV
ncbi:hypothetical protein ACFQS5_17520 [Salinirubellus sp. GCM10025899]|uniref:hypothetical protein n=1 Tax=Salinirubellus sp. GCM10025899 TaxID=3252689 RepID=UPI00360D74B3